MRRRGPWFLVAWLVAAAAALGMYMRWHVQADLIGIVETRSHVLAAQEGGVIDTVLAPIGQHVRRGDAVALLDTSDLRAERDQVEASLATVERVMAADRERFAMEHDVLALAVAERRGDRAARTAELESRRAEARALEAEIARLRDAEGAGLGHAEQLGELVIRRHAAEEFVAALSARIGGTPRADAAVGGLAAKGDAVLTSKIGDRLAEARALRDRLIRLAERERKRVVVAPSDGYIVTLHARPGDTVPAFAPVATLEETGAEYVEVYLPEARDLDAGIDDSVVVLSKRKAGGRVSAQVSFVHPGYERIPDRLMFGRQVAWAQKMRVRLPPGHRLRPGESVRVRMQGARGWSAPWSRLGHASSPDERAAEPRPREPDSTGQETPPSSMRLPKGLRDKTRFEPSGLVWLADLERFLIVSDDTGHKGRANHAPWVFLSDIAGRVEASPLPIAGLASINDLEAATLTPDGHLLLMTSASVNKKGRRETDRELLLKVRRKGRRLELVASVPLLRTIEASYGPEVRRSLGLEAAAADGRPRLNIEAMTWHEDGLLLGLKEPVPDRGALLWRLDRPDALFSGAPLDTGQLRLEGHIDLGRHHGRPAGISDLVATTGGALLVASTVPRAPDAEQVGALFRMSRSESGAWRVRELRRFPGLKPEGLAIPGDDQVFVVMDTGDLTPLFALLDLPP